MKNYLKTFIVFVISLTIFNTINAATDPFYSCDPVIDAWVKANKNEFSNISRTELVKFTSVEKQMAIFRSFTPQRKAQIWNDKIAAFLSEQTLNEKEIKFIVEITSAISLENLFDAKNKKTFELVTEAWEKRMKSELGWSQNKIMSFSYSWMTETELKELFTTFFLQSSSGCICNSSYWCLWINRGVCAIGGCSIGGECGFLGSKQCQGMCVTIEEPQQ